MFSVSLTLSAFVGQALRILGVIGDVRAAGRRSLSDGPQRMSCIPRGAPDNVELGGLLRIQMAMVIQPDIASLIPL